MRKDLGPDPNSNMAEMVRDNRKIVPMNLDLTDEPPQVFSSSRRKIEQCNSCLF